MPKILYNGNHAGAINIEGYTFKKGVNEVSQSVANHVYSQWMLKNRHFVLVSEPIALVKAVATPLAKGQTQAEYEALEAIKNAKSAELAAADIIAAAAAKKAASQAK